MADLVRQESYIGEARSRLPHQFQRKPRIDGFLVAVMQEVQLLEDNMFVVFIDRLLQNSPTGDLLDKIGEIVGEPRNGQADAPYLLFITARIKTNRSDGKRETLIQIALLLNGNMGPIVIREYLKGIEIEVNSVSVNPYLEFIEFLERAKPAGTKLKFYFSMVAKSLTLTRTSVSGGVTTVSTQRKGSVSVFGIGGGVFAGVFG